MSYKFNETDILITQLGDEGVAFNSNTNEYFSLNETSFKILKGIEHRQSIKTICEQLVKEYDIAAPDCEMEVQKTIHLFLSKKLITEA